MTISPDGANVVTSMQEAALHGWRREVFGEDGVASGVLDAATVVTTDLEAGNGVVHVIDAVMFPPSIAATLIQSLPISGRAYFTKSSVTSVLSGVIQSAGKLRSLLATSASGALS